MIHRAVPRRASTLLLGLVMTTFACPAIAWGAFRGLDGRFAFDNNDLFGCTAMCPGPVGTVFSLNPVNGRRQTISRPSDAFNAFPRWSPRGDQLTFLSGPDTGYQLGDIYPPQAQVVVTALARPRRRVVPIPAGLTQLLDPSWARDGAHLMVVGVDAATGRADLYRIGVDGSGLRQIRIAGLVGARHNVAQPVMSSTGRIAFVESNAVYVLTRGGRALRLHRGVNPDFSPDGKRIVFYDPQDATIYSIGIDGRGARRLATLRNDLSPHPVYSPSGRYVAFISLVFSHPAQLKIMNVDGSHVRTAAQLPGHAQNLDWQALPAAGH